MGKTMAAQAAGLDTGTLNFTLCPIIPLMSIEDEIDQLFQLAPGEFTEARNDLAKRAGKDGTAIKGLTRPTLAAWAVNQLHWKDPERYDALVAAANGMRRTHKAVIEGKRGDLRAAGREHDLAMEAALKRTLAILEEAGQPATDATRQAILNTLRALPSSEPPGRLTGTLAPGGFEMLAGITPGPAPKRTAPKAGRASTATGSSTSGQKAPDAKAERDAAERAVRDADQGARHAEFETARAARDVTKAARRLEQARKALEDAESELASAEQEAKQADRGREAADRKSRDAHSALEAARSRLAGLQK
jgi:hypothetical protein